MFQYIYWLYALTLAERLRLHNINVLKLMCEVFLHILTIALLVSTHVGSWIVAKEDDNNDKTQVNVIFFLPFFLTSVFSPLGVCICFAGN